MEIKQGGTVSRLLSGVPGVSGVELKGQEGGRAAALVHTGAEDIWQVCRDIFLAFSGAGAVLLELTPKKASLEEVFLELSEPATGEAAPAEESDREEDEDA